MKVDRMSMAHALEVRVPFLDHNLVEFGVNLSASNKINLIKNKIILRKWMKNRLPKKIYKRPKRGFSVPINMWLKNTFLDNIENSHEQYRVPYVNEDIFKKSLHKLKSDKSDYYSNYFYSSYLWNYFIFDKWVDQNADYIKK